MFPDSVGVAEQALAALQAALGPALYSCAIYGSTVRGNAIPGVSDVNLLIVLKDSKAREYQAVADSLRPFPQTDPFILPLVGLDRTVNAFAAKFASIQRNYRHLYGVDFLAGLQIDTGLARFLTEQALRNLRLRLVYAFVTRARTRGYEQFLRRNVVPLFVQCSEILRLNGVRVPKSFEERVPVLANYFALDAQTLTDLLQLKAKPSAAKDDEARAWHERVVPLLDTILDWVERHWPPAHCA